MVRQEVFRAAFEEWVPQALQVAYSYAEGHDAVERFWVVAYLGETVTPSVVYSAAGKVLRPHELDQAIPELDCSTEAQLEYLLTPLLELTSELDDKVTAAGEELPTRIVLRYDVAEEEMNADMTYDEIAETLGLKMGTVRSRSHRGRAQLREALMAAARDDEEARLLLPQSAR